MPIDLLHATSVATLPFHHRDPFDRILVSQCLAEGMPLISVDAKLDPYDIRRLW
jgi:PIN domain nuclease of toxin-antitoxin system